ncbi:hypothetical protein MRX96_032758 [Rhipicephalus microplus]
MPHRDSDSDSSRRKRKKRTHARSGSSSSDSPDRYRRKRRSRHSSRDKSRRRRSRSDSSSRYSSSKVSSSRRRRSGSRHRRSRSRSSAPRKRSRTPKHRSRRSRSSSSSRRRSRSSSDSPRRSRKTSASVSPKRVRKPGDPLPSRTGNETDKLKQKIQQVIKAAATANAELRERGLLPSGSSKEGAAGSGTSTPPSVLEQLQRARLIDDINAPLLQPAVLCFPQGTWKKGFCVWEKPELLIHPKLKEATEVKLERWRKKLAAERRKRINGTTTSGLMHNDT